jgi:hypothetical protein
MPQLTDDFIWEKYRWGEALNILDPQTNQPTTRNMWDVSNVLHSTLTPGRQPAERNHPFFEDTSIEGTATPPRAVPRLTPDNPWPRQFWRARVVGIPTKKSVEEIVAEMRQHYLPGVIEIPAAVGEIVRLQNKGYRLVVNH